jgi:CheY-like chemotaxis protein
MDGYDLATALRRLPGLAGLQLIAVTGYGQDIDKQRTTRAGFRHHLIKPVDITTLERALNSAHGNDGEPS